MKDAGCWLVASSLVFRFIALGWNMRNYLSQPFDFLLIGSCPEQWGCLYPVFKSQGHGSHTLVCIISALQHISRKLCRALSSALSPWSSTECPILAEILQCKALATAYHCCPIIHTGKHVLSLFSKIAFVFCLSVLLLLFLLLNHWILFSLCMDDPYTI